MSEEQRDGGKSTENGGPSSSSETSTAVATIVDSTITVLLPQLTETIEQQVARVVKATLTTSSTAGQKGYM